MFPVEIFSYMPTYCLIIYLHLLFCGNLYTSLHNFNELLILSNLDLRKRHGLINKDKGTDVIGKEFLFVCTFILSRKTVHVNKLFQ